MKTNKKLLLSISNTYHIHKTFFQRRQRSSTTKKLDAEAVYFNEVRYLDPRTSRWLGVDPAMHQGDYIPSAPIDDEARKRNGNLPGQGGIYNYVNMHVYHYAGNNPVKLVDPDGRDFYNFTSTPVTVITEKGRGVVIGPNQKYSGPIDGAKLQDGTFIKVNTSVSAGVKSINGEFKSFTPGLFSSLYNTIVDFFKEVRNLFSDEKLLLSGVYKETSDNYAIIENKWDPEIESTKEVSKEDSDRIKDIKTLDRFLFNNSIPVEQQER